MLVTGDAFEDFEAVALGERELDLFEERCYFKSLVVIGFLEVEKHDE
jgi:hypothetical protein